MNIVQDIKVLDGVLEFKLCCSPFKKSVPIGSVNTQTDGLRMTNVVVSTPNPQGGYMEDIMLPVPVVSYILTAWATGTSNIETVSHSLINPTRIRIESNTTTALDINIEYDK